MQNTDSLTAAIESISEISRFTSAHWYTHRFFTNGIDGAGSPIKFSALALDNCKKKVNSKSRVYHLINIWKATFAIKSVSGMPVFANTSTAAVFTYHTISHRSTSSAIYTVTFVIPSSS